MGMQKAKKYVMALDQGTTSSRCILFDRSGKVCSVAQKEFSQYYPKPGWVEHNPMEIWSSQLSVAVEAMGQIGAEADDIAAIGITNQRETTICFSKKTGKPVYPAIVWQCRRTADKIDALKKDGFDKVIRERTGLIPDAYFSGARGGRAPDGRGRRSFVRHCGHLADVEPDQGTGVCDGLYQRIPDNAV